jgi:hypothetical protein
LAADHQRADDPVGRKQRHDQQGAEAGAHHDVEHAGRRIVLHVGDLDRHALLRRLADRGLAEADMTIPDLGNDSLVHAIGRAQPEFLGGLVEYVDRAGLGAGELGRLGHDGGQHGLEVDGRVHGLADLAERLQLLDRLRQLARARLHLLEQPHVLDRDHCLVGEGLEQLFLRLRDRSGLGPADDDDAERITLAQHRHA